MEQINSSKIMDKSKALALMVSALWAGSIIAGLLAEQYSETAGMFVFSIIILIAFVLQLATILTNKNPKGSSLMAAPGADIAYQAKDIKFLPVSDVVIAGVSFIWLFISSLNQGGLKTDFFAIYAVGFFSIFDFIAVYGSSNIFNEYIFLISQTGILIQKEAWSKELKWEQYKSFNTVQNLNLGGILQYVPFLSWRFTKDQQYLIRLYRKTEYKNVDLDIVTVKQDGFVFDQISTMPDVHERVMAYLQQHLPLEKRKLSLYE